MDAKKLIIATSFVLSVFVLPPLANSSFGSSLYDHGFTHRKISTHGFVPFAQKQSNINSNQSRLIAVEFSSPDEGEWDGGGDTEAESDSLYYYQTGKTAFEKRDYPNAIENWEIAAQLKNNDAEFGLGEIYQSGLGVHPDKDKAKHWFSLAASHGNTAAAVKLKEFSNPSAEANVKNSDNPKTTTQTGPSTHYRVAGISSDDRLNIRNRPNANGDIVASIPYNGGDIKVLRCVPPLTKGSLVTDKKWCQIEFGIRTGWVNGKFLRPIRRISPITSTGSTSNANGNGVSRPTISAPSRSENSSESAPENLTEHQVSDWSPENVFQIAFGVIAFGGAFYVMIAYRRRERDFMKVRTELVLWLATMLVLTVFGRGTGLIKVDVTNPSTTEHLYEDVISKSSGLGCTVYGGVNLIGLRTRMGVDTDVLAQETKLITDVDKLYMSMMQGSFFKNKKHMHDVLDFYSYVVGANLPGQLIKSASSSDANPYNQIGVVCDRAAQRAKFVSGLNEPLRSQEIQPIGAYATVMSLDRLVEICRKKSEDGETINIRERANVAAKFCNEALHKLNEIPARARDDASDSYWNMCVNANADICF